MTLFIGITTWNSAAFIEHAVLAWKRCTEVPVRIVVLDNGSTDGTVALACSAGAEVVVELTSQADALNQLLRLAHSRFALLTHADVIVLSRRWFSLCTARFSDPAVALVSPEDVGCGPFTRPFGAGMPESSFLLFERSRTERARRLRFRPWRHIPILRKELDFYGPHVTHHLPQRLRGVGLTWSAMQTQTSDRLPAARYGPYPDARVWTDELAYLRYGLGNFYSLDGVVTHYHNWYERVPKEDFGAAAAASARSFPFAYVRDYTRAFLEDYAAGRLVVPAAAPRVREPVAL